MARSDIYNTIENDLTSAQQLIDDNMSEDIEVAMDSTDEGYYAALEEELYGDEPLGEDDNPLGDIPHDENIAEYLEDGELTDLASEISEVHENNIESRSEWSEIVSKAVDLLGFKIQEMDEPFPGACGASHPLLSQAVIKFQARAYKELYPSGGPVRTRVFGKQSTEKQEQAQRVRKYMNWQTTEQMTEFGPELDRMLFSLGLMGSAFKKTYFDPILNRPVSRFVKAEDFYINYFASDLETASEYTQEMYKSANDVNKMMKRGVYMEIDLDPTNLPTDDLEEEENEVVGLSRPSNAEGHIICESHIDLDLGEDPSGVVKLPYIVTWDKESEKILAIRRNWLEDDEDKKKIVHFEHYRLIPGLGFYGYGYIHLIGGLASTATSNMRQLNDAGTFANLPGGFKATGLRVLAPDEPIAPGEWREVNSPAGEVSKSLYPFPYKEPSPTLSNLLQYIVTEGKDLADQSDKILQEATNYGPVGTTMALLEHSAKLYSAIHKRLHEAQGRELKRLARINFKTLPDSFVFDGADGSGHIYREDFNLRTVDVIPVSDPNMPSESHRIAKVNAIKDIAMQAPNRYDMNAIDIDLFTAMGVEEPERYLTQQQQPFSGDPISEISAAVMGKPIAAKLEQAHDAHIMVKGAVLNNPAYAENQQMRGIILSNINEHLAMKFTLDILDLIGDEQMTQAVLSGEPLPPEMQNMVAVEAAKAVDKLLEVDIAKTKALRGESNDPIIELQMREFDLRRQKQAFDMAQDIAKLKINKDKLELKEAEVMIDDVNTDLDREADIQMAKMRNSGGTNR